MRVGTCGILALSLAAGCSYPEFEFAPVDAHGADVTVDSAGFDAVEDVATDVVSDGAPAEVAGDDATLSDAMGDGATDTSVADAATDTRDAASDARDSASDARDGAVDAPIDTFDARPVRFCDVVYHFFCSDFDASTQVEFGWSNFGVFGGGAITLENTATSLPRALRAVAAPASGAPDVAAFVTRSFTAPTVASVARIEADIQLDAATYGGGTLFLLKLQRSGGRGVVLEVGATGLRLVAFGDGTSYKMVPLAKVVTPGTWFHVRLDATLRLAGGSAKVWIDGTQYADETNLSTATGDDTQRDLVVGLYGEPPLLPFGARYDSVTLDFP